MVPICSEWWCTEANEATQTHCYNPVAPAYLVWAYYVHGQQHRCQEDPVTSTPADWRRQPGRPHITWLSTVQQDMKQHHLTLPEAADLAQNCPLWRMMSTYGATQCMPETMTTTDIMDSSKPTLRFTLFCQTASFVSCPTYLWLPIIYNCQSITTCRCHVHKHVMQSGLSFKIHA